MVLLLHLNTGLSFLRIPPFYDSFFLVYGSYLTPEPLLPTPTLNSTPVLLFRNKEFQTGTTWLFIHPSSERRTRRRKDKTFNPHYYGRSFWYQFYFMFSYTLHESCRRLIVRVSLTTLHPASVITTVRACSGSSRGPCDSYEFGTYLRVPWSVTPGTVRASRRVRPTIGHSVSGRKMCISIVS